MAQPKSQRISIGFVGAQVIAARVGAEQLAAFMTALEAHTGWFALVVEDATMHIDLAQVCFVRVDSDEPRVGFGA
jgi:hypothetical protein